MGFREEDFAATFAADPRHAVFWFARYKFVSKMLAGMPYVVEIGSGNGFAGAIVRQSVGELTQTNKEDWNPASSIRQGQRFDGAFALDVIEHIPQDEENIFVMNIADSLTPHGTLIIGTPSIESQPYASAPSQELHINCYSAERLDALLKKHFHCAYSFGMNDETLTTGYPRMRHYLLALACVPRR